MSLYCKHLNETRCLKELEVFRRRLFGAAYVKTLCRIHGCAWRRLGPVKPVRVLKGICTLSCLLSEKFHWKIWDAGEELGF